MEIKDHYTAKIFLSGHLQTDLKIQFKRMMLPGLYGAIVLDSKKEWNEFIDYLENELVKSA